jgi:hypothetical protein
MTMINENLRGQVRHLWRSSWPLWTLLIFASLAAAHLLPSGYVRAVVAAPILLIAPGSLTLGAIFNQHRMPHGAVFVAYAALLGAIWSAFASLLLYTLGILITADSTYWCLLLCSAALTVFAEAQIVLCRPGRGRRAAGRPDAADAELFENEAKETERLRETKRPSYYGILAIVAGVSLLVGGVYAYEHLPHPAPVGYTWIAWTGPRVEGDIHVGANGTHLRFQIVHHETDVTEFRLSAGWLGTTLKPLAKPLTFTMGPDKIFNGALFVPPLPDGCTYRIVVTLTAPRHVDVQTKEGHTWSINADIRDPSKPSKTCS